jgi:hypothetical protein
VWGWTDAYESGECPRCARYEDEEHVSTRNSQLAAERKKLLVAPVVLSILWIAAVSVYVSNSASAPKSIVRSITDDSAAATQNRPLTPEQHLDLARQAAEPVLGKPFGRGAA